MSGTDATTLRDYAEPDASKLLPLLERGLAAYGLKPDAVTDRDLLDVRGAYLDRRGRFRVLVDGDTIVGMYGLRDAGDGVVELRKMYLDPVYKGRGFGKMLLEDALCIARAAGFRRMTLETNRVLIEAIGLYRSRGFVDVPREHLSCRCDLAMARDL